MALFGDSGIIGAIAEPFFGEAGPGKSGAFPGLPWLGVDYLNFLRERLNTPTVETKAFRTGSQAIRDAIGRATGATTQGFSDRAVRGGFMDSGAFQSGLIDIERGGAQAYAQQLADLFLGLELSRDQGVLPYLAGGAQEFAGAEGNWVNEILDILGGVSSSYVQGALAA